MTVPDWILKLFHKILLSYKYIVVVVFILVVFFSQFFNDELKLQSNDYSNANFKVLGLNIPSELEFAGEKVPQNDYEIKQDLEKEFFNNKSWKNSSLQLFQRAQRWFPLIEAILKQEGIPDDFKYVAVIESHLSNVVSPMGATGFWQLMPETAQHYGLEISSEVDERLDVEKATYVACKHFKDAHNYFRNWTLAAAAYNVGIGGIQKALKKQSTDNYYDLLLNKETGSFVYRILAYKTLLSNPSYFGVKNKLRVTSYPTMTKIKIDSTINNFEKLATHLNTNLLTLKTFNPWLISDKLSNQEKKEYFIKIPKNKNLDVSVYNSDLYPKKNYTDSLVSLNKVDTIKLIHDTIIQ